MDDMFSVFSGETPQTDAPVGTVAAPTSTSDSGGSSDPTSLKTTRWLPPHLMSIGVEPSGRGVLTFIERVLVEGKALSGSAAAAEMKARQSTSGESGTSGTENILYCRTASNSVFCIDTCPAPKQYVIDGEYGVRPLYERLVDSTIGLPTKGDRWKPSTSKCFNCGAPDHSSRDCGRPHNREAGLARRRMFERATGKRRRLDVIGTGGGGGVESARYFDASTVAHAAVNQSIGASSSIDGQFDASASVVTFDSVPGVLSNELQRALGMQQGAPPPYYSRFLQYGYPPGYLAHDDGKCHDDGHGGGDGIDASVTARRLSLGRSSLSLFDKPPQTKTTKMRTGDDASRDRDGDCVSSGAGAAAAAEPQHGVAGAKVTAATAAPASIQTVVYPGLWGAGIPPSVSGTDLEQSWRCVTNHGGAQ